MPRLLACCLLLAALATLPSCETGGSALDRPSIEQTDDHPDTFHPGTPPVYDRRGYVR